MPELTISDVEAFQGASSVEAGDVEVIAYSGGNLPVVEQGQPTVALVDTSDTEIDPAEQDTLESVLTELQGSLDVSAVTVPVEQQTAVRAEDSTGTTINPAEDSTVQDVVNELQSPLDVSGATVTTTTDSSDAGPFTARTTSVSTTVSVKPGRFGDETAVHVDASGSGTLTVGVSTDGGTTVDERTLSYDSTGLLETVPGFGYVEASANQNLNALSLSAKGL